MKSTERSFVNIEYFMCCCSFYCSMSEWFTISCSECICGYLEAIDVVLGEGNLLRWDRK